MKKLLGIVVLGLLWCNTSFSDEIHIKCTFKKFYFFEENYSKKEWDGAEWSLIWSFDEEKKFMTDTNYQNNPPIIAIINEKKFYWLFHRVPTDNSQKIYREKYGPDGNDIILKVLSFEIDRYSGEVNSIAYLLNKPDGYLYTLFETGEEANTLSSLMGRKKQLEMLKEKNKQNKLIGDEGWGSILEGVKYGDCEKENREKKF